MLFRSRHWARALAYAAKGRPPAAREEAAKVDQSLADYRARTKRPENPQELEVARQELAAHLDFAEGRTAKAYKEFELASKAERRLTYTEPPYYPRPVAEAWGRAALKGGKVEEARRAFRIAQEQYPGDAHAILPGDAGPAASTQGAGGLR